MENLAQLAPLLILIPATGAILNFFWGNAMGDKLAGIVGSTASGLTFLVALGLFAYISGNSDAPAVINFPLLDGWIRIPSAGVEIAWQQRVDTLSVTMMMFVTFVGTVIHIYSIGYMHGDARVPRFFAYLNMFLTFMLILVSANNFLMMFVGWEGVGLCSYLLIGFWWEKPDGEGWKNSNAGRKAFIVNRIGDFGVLMAMFFIFWTFGTLDFYKAGEISNLRVGEAAHVEHAEDDHAEATEHAEEAAHEETAAHEEDPSILPATLSYESVKAGEIELSELGVFGQTQYWADYQQDETHEEVEVEIGSNSFKFDTVLVIATLFLLLGATGKSAQIPLLVWLPDAMAGPTPVSALIHAATMVTAGVYMMVRSNVLFHNAEATSFIVTAVGTFTALAAGFIAVAQFDIKRVLAYSTISQLGFMVAAVGIGAYTAAIFHMVTHSFFKALLFLGSGSVIHGMEHGHHHVHEHGDHDHDAHEGEHAHDDFDPQDMRFMGGLRHKMPITYWTYLIGTLALAGIFPFAGFWSKDEILADGWEVGLQEGLLKGYMALFLLLLAAAFTAFYMWRQIEMVFHGEPRHEAAEHAPESVRTMTVPLMTLAFFSIFIGFINTPSGIAILPKIFGTHKFGDFLGNTFYLHSLSFNSFIASIALAAGIGAIFAARYVYGNGKALTEDGKDPLQALPSTGALWELAHARLYWDEIYHKLFINPYSKLAKFLADTIDWNFLHDYLHDSVIKRGYDTLGRLLGGSFDLGVIDGAVNGTGLLVKKISSQMRRVQTGYVRTYTVALLLGAVLVIIIMLWPLIEL
jgi:NADH-quinone oxidoreductase subunit L